MTPKQALKEAYRQAGSRYALAKKLNELGYRITTSAVYQWGDKVPAERVLAVEAATGVSRHDLSPKMYPRETAPQRARSEYRRGNA